MTNIDVMSKYSGVSLIEVLVAFVMLSLSVTVLLRIFSTGATNIIVSQQYIDAMHIAESRISNMGNVFDLTPTIENGVVEEKYAWEAAVEPYFYYEEMDQESYPVKAYEITVDVQWHERGHARNVQLNKIILKDN